MRTILIVEDNETCAETLQIAFESMPGMKTVSYTHLTLPTNREV